MDRERPEAHGDMGPSKANYLAGAGSSDTERCLATPVRVELVVEQGSRSGLVVHSDVALVAEVQSDIGASEEKSIQRFHHLGVPLQQVTHASDSSIDVAVP